MISELKDEDILDFLMTSDFDGDYSPEELKYLLVKWRYFYRLTHGNMERVKIDSEGEVNKLKDEATSLRSQITSLQINLREKDEDLVKMSNRKLSWKERFYGKIIKEDESSRI